MKVHASICLVFSLLFLAGFAWSADALEEEAQAGAHSDNSGWEDLFASDLSNADKPEDVWSVEDGVLTASEDEAIWTKREFDNFVLDLEFSTSSLKLAYPRMAAGLPSWRRESAYGDQSGR
ncbi:MAG: hypothetical protein KJ052_05980 [Candidatus Hydrogenedentes bacterium]|nr:hypothetical protein [Candidatus Hydrogenedentota bacterium]